jgi:hypothetical protein
LIQPLDEPWWGKRGPHAPEDVKVLLSPPEKDSPTTELLMSRVLWDLDGSRVGRASKSDPILVGGQQVFGTCTPGLILC